VVTIGSLAAIGMVQYQAERAELVPSEGLNSIDFPAIFSEQNVFGLIV
jgi:hypothetical protein